MQNANIVWTPQEGPQTALIHCPVEEIMYGGARSGGKALAFDEPVLTPFGWRPIGELKVGDTVCAPDGTHTRVIGVYPQGVRQLYSVKLEDGCAVDADLEHNWLVWTSNASKKSGGRRVSGERAVRIAKTDEIMRLVRAGKSVRIPVCKPAAFNVTSRDGFEIDPYTLGLLLGDGCLRDRGAVTLTTADAQVEDYWTGLFGADTRHYQTSGNNSKDMRAVGASAKDLKSALAKLGLLGLGSGDKFIPRKYLFAATENRWELLRGLMDTDGWAEPKRAIFYCTISTRLRDDVAHLARSLGALVAVTEKNPAGGKKAYCLRMKFQSPAQCFKLARKQAVAATIEHQSFGRKIVSVEPSRRAEAVCIQVDHPAALYITRDFIVTHNTDAAIGLCLIKGEKYGKRHHAIFFRRELTQLDAVITRAREIAEPLGWEYKEGTKTLRAANGATVKFRHLERDSDAEKYQGWSVQCVAVGTPVVMADGSTKPVEQVLAGDSVWTLEGPKRVRATVDPYLAECVRLRVLDPASGKVLAEQVQPLTHPVLTSVQAPYESSNDCSQGDARTHSCRTPWKSLIPHPRDHLIRKGACAWIEGEASGDIAGLLSNPIPGQLLLSNVPVVRALLPHQIYGQSHHGEESESRNPYKASAACGAINLESRAVQLSDQRQFGEALGRESQERTSCACVDVPPPQFCHEQPESAEAQGLKDRCWSDPHLCGEQPRHGSAGDQSSAQPRAGAAARGPSDPDLDGTGCIRVDNHPFCGSYVHPYTGERRQSTTPVELDRAEILYEGAALVCCLSVEDVSHYITVSRFVNQNTIVFEEATNFPDPKPVMKLKGILRSAHGVPCQMLLTSNPGGPGMAWVKKRYIDPAPRGWKIIPHTDKFSNKVTERIFIPSKVTDNKLLMQNDPLYVARLAQTGSEQLVRAWLEGDWNIVDGAFFPEFSLAKHVIPNVRIPEHWTVFRCGDWGSARPFAFYWCATASEPWLTPDGKVIPRGAIVVFKEYYGIKSDPETGEYIPNQGVRLYAEEVGRVLARMEAGIQPPSYGVIDPHATATDGGPSIAERIYQGSGGRVAFRGADNKRVPGRGAMGGWDQVRARLAGEDFGDGKGHRPMVYFMECCEHLIRTLPMQQHDEDNIEDIDTEGEDHALDALRYGLMSRPYSSSIDISRAFDPITAKGYEAMNLEDMWGEEMSRRNEAGFAGRI